MIRTLIGRHLHHHRFLIGGLALGLMGIEVFLIHLAAAFERSPGPGIEELLGMLPEIIQNVVQNLMKSQVNAISFPGFVAFGFMHPAVMVGSIAYTVVLATTPAEERDSGMLDLVLARPVPRTCYVASCIVGIVLGALVISAGALAGCALGLALVDSPNELPWTRYLPCALGLGMLVLAVGGFALLIATTARRRGTAVVRIVAVLLVAYVVATLAEISSLIEPLKWLSPFYYFKPIQAALEPGFDAADPAVLLGVFVVTAFLAVQRFRLRDV